MQHFYMYMSMLANLCCMMFLVLLVIVYFRKKSINNTENYIYRRMLNANLLFLVTELILFSMCIFFVEHMNILLVVEKLYLYCSLECILLFIYYIYTVTNTKYSDMKVNEALYKKFIIVRIILVIIMFLLPIEHHMVNGYIQYSYGAAPIFMALCSMIAMTFGFVTVFINRKSLDKKKVFPLYVFVISMAVFFTIHYFEQSLFLTSLSITLISYLMFFTIENPDLKLLEEVHKSKEISDNANEEKTMFLFNMTNEIRQIIKDIDYNADSILNIGNDNINNYVRDIKSSIAKFNTITNEILDISQVDVNSVKIYKDKYSIKLLIKELVQIYNSKCEGKGLDFRSSIASDIPEHLYGDSVSLKNVLVTILDNSVTYTNSGFIEFNIETIIKNDICRLVITVEDSGRGMKADELNDIFDSKDEIVNKYNLDNKLYNVKKLVTLMGGTIIASSVYGKGTKMKIVLDQKIAKEDSKLEKYENIFDRKRILLVDDSEASGKIISKMVDGTNIILDIVTTGKEALDKIRNKEKYDLILLDEEMQPLDGITVMKRLGEIRTFNTRVILLTRNNNYEYNEEYLKYGFSSYLLKPVDKEKLFSLINNK